MDEALLIVVESLLAKNTQNLSQLAIRIKNDVITEGEDDDDDEHILQILMQVATSEKNRVAILQGYVQWCRENDLKIIKPRKILELCAGMQEMLLGRLEELMSKPRNKETAMQCVHTINCFDSLLDGSVLIKFYVNFRRNFLCSLFDRCFDTDSSKSPRQLAATISSMTLYDSNIFQKILLPHAVVDIYYDCTMGHVEKRLVVPTTDRSFDSVIRSDSREIVLLSTNEESVSTNSSPARNSLLKTIEMITFCVELENHFESRSARQWDWRSVLAPLVPEICRWVERQFHLSSLSSVEQEPIDLANFSLEFSSLADNLFDLVQARQSSISNAISVGLKQFSTDLLIYLSRCSQKNMKNEEMLYALLDSVSNFSGVLEKMHSVLTDQELSHLRAQFVDLANCLVEQVTFNRRFLLLTGIFHDAESHDWQKEKSFFEDEKVSFSIQMWCLHMKELGRQLKSCRPIYARRIFSTILCFSISWFAQRYSRARPSCSRVAQFKSDVAAILLNAHEFILMCRRGSCGSLDDESLAAAHEYCTDLLATMVVTCAPLHQLSDAYRNGFSVGNKKETNWLDIVMQNQENESIDVCLKSICCQFEPHWPTVVQLLVIDDAAVPVAIVDHFVETGSNSCGNIVRVILEALVSCQTFPHQLGSMLVHLVKKNDHWEEILWFTSCDQQLPIWVHALDDLLEEYCTSIVSPLYLKLLQQHSLQTFYDFAAMMNEKISSIDVAVIASRLTDDAVSIFATLPLPMQLLFERLQRELSQSKRNELVADSVYLHMMTMKCCRLLTRYLKDARVEPGQFVDNLLQTVKTNRLFKNVDFFSDANNGKSSKDDEYAIAAAQMIRDNRAFDSLRHFHEFILENHVWLLATTDFSRSTDEQQHSRILNFQLDWHKALLSGIVSSETTLRLLLANRWEMHSDEQSPDVPQDVAIIKTLYKIKTK